MLIGFQWSSFVAIILGLHTQGRYAIVCNECVYSGPGYDYNCVTNSGNESLPTVSCTNACLSVVMITVATNTMYSIQRGCQTNEVEGCDGHPSTETCNHVCSDSDLCNDDNYEPIPISTTTTEAWTGTTTVYSQPSGYNCYSCSYLYHPDVEEGPCVHSAESSAKVHCPEATHVCTIVNQYSKEYGAIRSFLRSCLPRPSPMQDNCVDDIYFTTYTTYCNWELCNSGSGIIDCTPPGGGGGGSTGGAVTEYSPAISLLIAAFVATAWLNK